ncbi:MAG: hypothetical protein ACFE9Y_11320 [Promethearchaeota archaeon]
MNLEKWNNWAFITVIFGSVQFTILTFIAMFFYKGGTYIDSSTSHYIFWYNYFSDLGRFMSHSGTLNLISFILFTIALALWGITQIPFYIAFLRFFIESKKLKQITYISSIFGVMSGIYYVGIAFTPSHLLGNLHDLFVFLGFGSIFLCMILYSIIIYKDENYPKFYANVLIISMIILGLYFTTLFSIQNINLTSRLFISAIGQKIMIYTLIICCIIQGYGALKQLNA